MFAMIAKITPCHGSISPLFDQKHDLPVRGAPPLALPARNEPRAITHYRVSVFNFAPTWDQFTLISIATARPRRPISGAALAAHVWRKAARLSSVAGFSPRPRVKCLVNYGLALHRLFPPGAAPDLTCSRSGASARAHSDRASRWDALAHCSKHRMAQALADRPADSASTSIRRFRFAGIRT